MTDILTRDPNDSDEFPLGIGEERTVILRRDTGEATQRINPRIIDAPSFDAIPRRIVDIDDTVIYMPETIGCVDLEGPQPKPTKPLPPQPKPQYAGADETQVHTILDSLDGGHAELDGWLRPDGYVGRHRDPLDRIAVQGEAAWGRLVEAAKPGGEPRRLRVQVGVGAFIAFAAAVSVAVLVVFS